MGFDDGSAQVRNIRDPGQPTAKEHQEHMTTHRPYRSWCKFCVMGRAVNAPHRRSDAEDDLEGVRTCQCGFLGERESEEHVPPVLVIREQRHKMTWAMLVPQRERSSLGSQRERRGSLINLDTTGSRSDVTTCWRLRHWRGKSHKLAKKVAGLFQRGRRWETASSWGHRTCGRTRCRPGQNTESSARNQNPT